MSLKKLMTNSANYNSWVNQQYVAWLTDKSEELLNKEIPSSFSSILKTISHILESEKYWYSILAETNFKQTEKEFISKDETLNELLKCSEQLAELINSYSEEDLFKKVKIDSPWFQSDLAKYEYLQHVINHGLFHRGQIVTIARNVGITDIPMTDYNFYNVSRQSK